MFQHAVGGGDHAHVDLNTLAAADALKAAILQHTQQLHLHRRGDIADFVQEKRSFMGLFEAPLALANGASERPFLVAEKLAFQERLRHGGAIDSH